MIVTAPWRSRHRGRRRALVSSALAAMNGRCDRDRGQQLRQYDLPARERGQREVRERPVLDLVGERAVRDREHDERRDRAGEHRAEHGGLEFLDWWALLERSIRTAMRTGMAASTVMIIRRQRPDSCRSVSR
jgi:hypothetical protein